MKATMNVKVQVLLVAAIAAAMLFVFVPAAMAEDTATVVGSLKADIVAGILKSKAPQPGDLKAEIVTGAVVPMPEPPTAPPDAQSPEPVDIFAQVGVKVDLNKYGDLGEDDTPSWIDWGDEVVNHSMKHAYEHPGTYYVAMIFDDVAQRVAVVHVSELPPGVHKNDLDEPEVTKTGNPETTTETSPAPEPETRHSLPYTGGNTIGFLLIGLGIAAVGGVALLVSSKRRAQ